MSFTKAAILQGANRVETVSIPGVAESIPLKPLTDGQYSEIEQIRTKGMVVKGNPERSADVTMDIDLEVSTRQSHLADVKAVYYSLATEEKWTEEEIEAISPPGIVSKIAAEVYRISGVEQIDKVKKFRKDSRRS